MLIKEIVSDTAEPISGKLVFQQNQVPPLNAGTGTITVQQTVLSTRGQIPETIYSNVNNFAVNGPRFTLPVGAITSVYPPENAQGEYDRVLPHVCFNRATLPWERQAATPTYQNQPEAADQAPWLGILLLYDTDPAVTVSDIEVKGLVSPAEKKIGDGKDQLPVNYFFPVFKLDDNAEKYTDKCLAVDIPVALFNKVAPCHDDLPWLAHVREIQPGNKQSAQYVQRLKSISDEKALPKISTVIGNRLPLPGAKTTAYLVSFENWDSYLPDENGVQNLNIPKATTTIRMVLLKQWDFYAIDRKQTFSGYLKGLNKKDGVFGDAILRLQTDEDTGEAGKAIQNAFDMGFVPLNHHTRQAADTVSWYHGPFVPYNADRTIDIPVNGADTCTAYNRDTGMFDVSYAAAWQLGRLLALQNGHFAQTLYNWKKSNPQTIIANFEEEFIKKKLNEIVDDQKQSVSNTVEQSLDQLPLHAQQDLLGLMNESLSTILSQFITNKDNNDEDK